MASAAARWVISRFAVACPHRCGGSERAEAVSEDRRGSYYRRRISGGLRNPEYHREENRGHVLDANPESIVCHPLIPMAPFNRTLGEVPMEFGGGNRYRVIWAPSRKILRFTSGISETVSAYGKNGIQPIAQQSSPKDKAGECWILEQWVNPYRDCTEVEWNTLQCISVSGSAMPMTRLQAMGPFPRQGYYWHAENTRILGDPSLTQVEAQILLVEDGMFRHTQWDNFCAIRRKEEAGEKRQDSINSDRIRDRSLIGSGEAWSSPGGGGRGTKTVGMKRTSRDLRRRGFSTKPGTVSVTPRGNKATYDLTPYVQL